MTLLGASVKPAAQCEATVQLRALCAYTASTICIIRVYSIVDAWAHSFPLAESCEEFTSGLYIVLLALIHLDGMCCVGAVARMWFPSSWLKPRYPHLARPSNSYQSLLNHWSLLNHAKNEFL